MQKFPVPEEFALKQTAPKIAGSGVIIGGDKVVSAYDLVEQMEYFYVRVVRAKELPGKDVTGTCDPYVEVKLGNYKGVTKHFEKKSNPEWNLVFAFAQEQLQASHVEVVVKDKDVVLDDFIGKVSFDLVDIPRRVPPDSPLAPQWYKLEDKKGEKLKKGRSCLLSGKELRLMRCFLMPGILMQQPLAAKDLLPSDKSRPPEVCVKVVLGNQALKTKVSSVKSVNPSWNEDLVFVGGWTTSLYRLSGIILKHPLVEGQKKEAKFSSKIHLRISLDGGYHVLDESTYYSSDYRPSSKLLWKSSIGFLSLE
ncbi:UNVERIFIED_CONTAM: FT-interacting protein 3 [Sesamum calycinum]|uniref:FT-interacting protein 3 n=1 Tax=Sesamum calycinum TaxID=2727403 RepID=A0AAW2SA51_9LAMI